MEMSDLDEAIKDYEKLYHDFENAPVDEVLDFRTILEGFVMNGTKLLYLLSTRYRPGQLANLEESLEHVSRTLIKVRLADEESLKKDMNLQSIKEDLLKFFEDSFANLKIVIRFHSPFHTGH